MQREPEAVSFPSDGVQLYGRLRHCAEGGPILVLLSGLGFHTFEYEPLAEHLAAEGVNSLSFDFRGHGRSRGARGRWTLDELARDARHAVDLVCQRFRGPVWLFGNSLGAMVAILTGAHDDRVVGVAASNATARIADFLLKKPRRAMFAVAKVVALVAPIRNSVNHFYSYQQSSTTQRGSRRSNATRSSPMPGDCPSPRLGHCSKTETVRPPSASCISRCS